MNPLQVLTTWFMTNVEPLAVETIARALGAIRGAPLVLLASVRSIYASTAYAHAFCRAIPRKLTTGITDYLDTFSNPGVVYLNVWTNLFILVGIVTALRTLCTRPHKPIRYLLAAGNLILLLILVYGQLFCHNMPNFDWYVRWIWDETVSDYYPSFPIPWIPIRWVRLDPTNQTSMYRLINTINGVLTGLEFVIPLIHSEHTRPWFSLYLDWAKHLPFRPASDLKVKFREKELAPFTTPNHTHGLAAGARSSASQFCQSFMTLEGYRTYSWQRSKTDARRGVPGSRDYYWASDVDGKPCRDPIQLDSALMLVDVDYYMDMEKFLASKALLTMTYSLTPTTAAESTGDFSFRFEANDEVTMCVGGGAKYTHAINDYNVDHLLVSTYGWDPYITEPLMKFLGLPRQTVIYDVERKVVDKHHSVVGFFPKARYTGLGALAARVLESPGITQFRPVQGDWVVMDVQDVDGLQRSVARVGKYTSATGPVAQIDTLKEIALQSKKGTMSAPYVKTVVPDSGKQEQFILTSFVNELDRAGAKVFTGKTTKARTINYLQKDGGLALDPKVRLVPYMNPIMRPGTIPVDSLGNDERTVAKRIVEVRSDTHLDTRGINYAKEFITQLGLTGTEEPVDFDTVSAKQSRPTQQAILEDATFLPDTEGPLKVDCFMKGESYGSTKAVDPRNITIVDPAFKLGYSRYMYAVATWLKTQPWYAFGLSPIQIATRVAEICSAAITVICTDYSRMDGRTAPAVREFELLFMLAFFPEKYHDEIRTLHQAQNNAQARTRFGIRFETLCSRLSGSPDTSNFNTLLNAFLQYVAKRRSGLDPASAFLGLGIYAGDDGLSADIQVEHIEFAAKLVGQKVTFEVYSKGDWGVNFLSRFYSDQVWWGTMDSCCDIKRQAAKFHYTGVLSASVTPTMKLLEKASSFALTDRNTPVIGEFVCAVLDLQSDIKGKLDLHSINDPINDHQRNELKSIRSYWSHDALDAQYPNANPGNWMEHYTTDLVLDRAAFSRYLEKAVHLEDLLEVPVCFPSSELPVLDAVAHVDDVLIDPEQVILPDVREPVQVDPKRQTAQPAQVRKDSPRPNSGEPKKRRHNRRGGRKGNRGKSNNTAKNPHHTSERVRSKPPNPAKGPKQDVT